MRFKCTFVVFVLFFSFSPLGYTRAAHSFLFNLKLGDQNSDVIELQRLLNRDPRTTVALSGSGSSGSETNYFGQLTKAAVIRFQNIYRSEVLAPVGLQNGTGFVGPSTRAKLNTLFTASQNITPAVSSAEATVTNPLTIPASNSVSSDIALDADGFSFPDDGSVYTLYASSQEAFPGESVTISGAHFSDTNNVVLLDGNTFASGLASTNDNTEITFIVPADAPTGVHYLTVKRSDKKTSEQKILFVIKKQGANRPIVHSVSPNSVTYGEEVTITGENFTDKNTLITSYGVVDPISSVGDTVTLKVEPYPNTIGIYPEYITKPSRNINWDVAMFVATEGGVSSEPVIITIQF